jgi:thioredoxin-dependent peroxiredoxin
MLEAGTKAPSFSLLDADGVLHKLEDFSGAYLVLYFYPRDDTPGCTAEACGFRDLNETIRKASAAVVGVSADSESAHGKFRDKYRLPFVLLSDPTKTVIEAYGAWGEKKMYGKIFQGISRSTFIIDGMGIIRKVFPKVSPSGHAAEIVAFLEELRG